MCQDCKDLGTDARAFQVSALDIAGMEATVRELERDWGGIDVLVNNAGITQVLPQEAAELAAFLVSDDNSYMNGETVILDGGV